MGHSMLRMGGSRIALGIASCFAGLGLIPASALAGYVNYPDFSRTGGLEINGSAEVTPGGTLRLTDSFEEVSSVFTRPNVIDATQTIRTSFEFHLHDGSADGFTFTIQRDPREADAIGDQGGALGYGDGAPDGITRSVAVEFDLYPDTFVSDDHVAILTDGITSDFGNTVLIAPASADIYGGPRFAWVDYKPKTRKLSVFVSSSDAKPAAPATSTTINLKKELGSASARAGFTAGTGGEWATQDIESWKVAN